MKFCKKLQHVAGLADPDWAPYWTNYKLMKKLIKELKLGVLEDFQSEDAPSSSHDECFWIRSSGGDPTSADTSLNNSILLNSRELAFFRLVHSEFRKATGFFEMALQEMSIREKRVRAGYELRLQPNAMLLMNKWSVQAKVSVQLHKQLVLLESFAIMNHCSYSKILKKHDKVTGRMTRAAFMQKVVAPSNISNYPELLQLISRCEHLCDEVSQKLVEETSPVLYDDERLFLETLRRLRGEGMSPSDARGEDDSCVEVKDQKDRRTHCGSTDDELKKGCAVVRKNRALERRSLPLSKGSNASDSDKDKGKPTAESVGSMPIHDRNQAL